MKDGYTELRKTRTFGSASPVDLYPRYVKFGETEHDDSLIWFVGDCFDLDFEDIPAEFFNHQLLECKTRLDDGVSYDAVSLSAFASEWGFAYSPGRYGAFDFAMPPLKWRGQREDEMRAAIAETDSAEGDKLPFDVISIAEMALSIELLQELALSMHEAIRADYAGMAINERREFFGFASVLNRCSCVPVEVGMSTVFSKLFFRPSITSAICNQVIETLQDTGTLWRECAAPDCNKRFGAPVVFKHQQNPKTKRPDADAIYCSPKCKSRHMQQKRRAGNGKANGKSTGQGR